jgi:hypothetical protein
MKALVAVVMSLGFLAALGLQDGQAGKPKAAPAFQVLDLYIDSGTAALGAYQVELKADAAGAKVVGIEGGEHAAFIQPPFYDPAALHEDQLRERVVLAAFSTDAELPSGRTRVARVHVQIAGNAKYAATLQTAGARAGEKIDAQVEVVTVGDAGDSR